MSFFCCIFAPKFAMCASMPAPARVYTYIVTIRTYEPKTPLAADRPRNAPTPTVNREAIEPHREIPVEVRRSKCGARVRRANIEHLKDRPTPTVNRQ